MYGFRFHQKAGKGIFHAHKHMNLIKDAGGNEGCHKLFPTVYGMGTGNDRCPFLLGVAGGIRTLYDLFPLGDVFKPDMISVVDREGARFSFGQKIVAPQSFTRISPGSQESEQWDEIGLLMISIYSY
jgi:hypothetical protein